MRIVLFRCIKIIHNFSDRNVGSIAATKTTMTGKRKRTSESDSPGKEARVSDSTIAQNQMKWNNCGGDLKPGLPHVYILAPEKSIGSEKIAAFDMDWCVIKPASGGKWPKNAADWKWFIDGAVIPAKMAELHEDNYKIVFITNQAGIEKGTTKASEIKKKMELIVDALNIPILCMMVTGQSHFRKPATPAWNLVIDDFNDNAKVDLSKCFFVGDAAGRAKDYRPGRPKDFSCSDRMFAANIGIDFKTPEEYFLDEKPANFSWGGSPDPQVLLKASANNDKNLEYHSNSQELVVLCGLPASGKSTFTKRYFENHQYLRVNRDTLGTPAKCIKVAKEALSKGRSVVIDNTNPTVADRSQYLDLAKQSNIPCRAIWLDTPWEVSQHLNYVRVTQTFGNTRRIPMVAYRTYKGKFKEPHTSEGFDEVVKVPFSVNFSTDDEKKSFMQWTTPGH